MNSAMPVGDIMRVQWRQVVAEHFDSPIPLGSWPGQYAAKWFTYPKGWPDTTHHGIYNPAVISVHDSCLDYWLHTDPVTGVPQVACISPILPFGAPQKGQLYQRHAMRFRCDAVAGYKFVPLLWPDSGNQPLNGEIDWPEASLDQMIHGYVHLTNTTTGEQEAYPTNVPISSGWHVCETIWSPGGVELKLDGVVIGNCTSRVPSTPMHLCLQSEDATDGTIPTAAAAGHILTDWIAIWSWEG